jgi:hypothetical protein
MRSKKKKPASFFAVGADSFVGKLLRNWASPVGILEVGLYLSCGNDVKVLLYYFSRSLSCAPIFRRQ